jgi:putative DNA primase/helicase
VERLAKADRRLAAEFQVFDADPDLLNTPEGIVDLRTGRLLAHDINAHCTKLAGTGPRAMPTPRWDAFLRFVACGDEEYAAYLYRALGYMLTGHTIEHAMFLAIGTGGNGKTVFANIVRRIMGDYAMTTPTEGLAAADSPQHPTDLARLRGARLAVAQETEADQAWAEAKIKRMTGGDAIPARFMRQDFFEYTPQFKLWVIGNHTPQLRNVDEAIRRRIQMWMFRAKVDAAQRNPRLEAELWEEAPGILFKMVQGSLAWRERGLDPPPVVLRASGEYLAGQDKVGSWIADRLVPGDKLLSCDAYESWQQWCRASGETRIGSQRKLTDTLKDRGYEYDTTGGQRGILGLSLSPNEAKRISQQRDAERNKRIIEQEAVVRLGRESMPAPSDRIPF